MVKGQKSLHPKSVEVFRAPPSPTFSCDKNHIYTRDSDGRVFPSVTQITDIASPFHGQPPKDPEYLAYRAKLGNAVHKMVELDLRRELDEESVTGIVADYLPAWRNARQAMNLRPICMERMVWSQRLGFIGRQDMRAIVDLGDRKDVIATIDIKTSNKIWENYPPQVGGYQLGWWEMTAIDDLKEIDKMGLVKVGQFIDAYLPEEGREAGIILRLRDNGKFEIKVSWSYDWIKQFVKLLVQFHESNGGWYP